ncbi:amino acid ABC transporter permease [Christensenella tenuis]|jgi:polar amino acid transport system permease protein|uniref:Amino acid ABC transporter permease n=1 Tax=Christensenella tenuis TaxID=2763033 RepID=A0ABR7ECL5_9FIRM|nr:amino acid ABC transporter permease [Christensenella tenuis]MBC5647378.1 amino acid ABC transporter permease [Christensenella tenuis]
MNILGTFAELAQGLGVTLALFALTLVCSIPLGFLGSHVSLGKNKPAKFIYNIYLVVMRGTPLILQVLFMYFGLNLAGIHIGRFESALLSFVLNYTAYFSEIFRGGIQSINRGQYEAASVLGLSKGLTMRKIVIPQVFKIVLPSLGNEVINLVKDTALVSIIALGDLLKIAYSASMREANIMPLVAAAVFYLAINAVVSLVLKKIEKRMNYYRI